MLVTFNFLARLPRLFQGYHQDSVWWVVLLGLQPQLRLVTTARGGRVVMRDANSAVCWEDRFFNECRSSNTWSKGENFEVRFISREVVIDPSTTIRWISKYIWRMI